MSFIFPVVSNSQTLRADHEEVLASAPFSSSGFCESPPQIIPSHHPLASIHRMPGSIIGEESPTTEQPRIPEYIVVMPRH